MTGVAGELEVDEDQAGKYRFRLKAGNGQAAATGEAYETRAAVKKGCESVSCVSVGPPPVSTSCSPR